jgi:alpha-N-arabinofuranosidase
VGVDEFAKWSVKAGVEPGGRAWKQTTFHPFALNSPTPPALCCSSPSNLPWSAAGPRRISPALSAVATLDAAVAGLGSVRVVEAVTYANKDPYWQATAGDSTSVLPAANVSVKADGGRLTAELPAVSWSMIRLGLES